MSNVRLIALALAGVLLMIIAFASYRKRQQARHNAPEIGDIEDIDLLDEFADFDDTDATENRADDIIQIRRISAAQSSPALPEHNGMVVINLYAEPGTAFSGYELLQSMLAVGLRYGDMNIFHRYRNKNGTGEVLFSVASLDDPGTFDIQQMGGYQCKGLSFFMRLQHNESDHYNQSIMLHAAQQLAEDLGGDLYDIRRQPIGLPEAQYA